MKQARRRGAKARTPKRRVRAKRAARARTAKQAIEKRRAVQSRAAKSRSTKPRVARKKPAQAKPATRVPRQTTRAVGAEAVASLERDVRRLRSARGRLERRLTAAVQEIGTIRQFEIRAQVLESELAKRDAELDRLRTERDEQLGGASIVSTPVSPQAS